MALPFQDLIPFSDDDDEDDYGDSESDDDLEYSDDDSLGDDGAAPVDKAGEVELEALDKATEVQIEGDFSRFIESIRRPSGEDILSKDWDTTIQAQEDEFRDDLRAATGIGKRRGAKRGARRNEGPPLSLQVKAMLGEGNQAYVDGDTAKASTVMQEVIRIEPKAVQAWSVLAKCYDDAGDREKALRSRIMAAHMRHDAEEWESLARESRSRGYNQQALYCYRKVYVLEPDNVDAIWDRATLAIELGELRLAKSALLAVLKQMPHNLNALDAIRPVLVELGDFEHCAKVFQDALDYYSDAYPRGPGGSATAQTTNPTNGGSFDDSMIDPALQAPQQNQPVPPANQALFTEMHLLILADLYNTTQMYESSIHAVRKGARWFQGRRSQRWWDACEDDREYAPHLESGGHYQGGQVAPGGYPLDLNLRHRLAIARIHMGDIDEGLLHANIVLNNDVLDYAALFLELADAFFDKDMWPEARGIYERLGVDENTSSIYILMQTAACMKMMHELKEAAEVYEHIRKADPTNNEPKMKLAEIYEISGEPRKALELVYEVIASRKRGSKDSANSASPSPGPNTTLFEESKSVKSGKGGKKAKLTPERLREIEAEREKEVQASWKRIKSLWNAVFGVPYPTADHDGDLDIEMRDVPDNEESEAEREWFVETEKLIESYRETRALFTSSRNPIFKGMFPSKPRKNKASDSPEEDQDRIAARLHLEMEMESALRKKTDFNQGVASFRGIVFSDWLRLALSYAFMLTRRNQFPLADEVLRHLLTSNPFLRGEPQSTLRLGLIACALHIGNHAAIIEHARKLITTHQFNNEAPRILLASLSPGLRSTDAFISSTLQKHMFRDIRLLDMALKGGDLIRWNASIRRWAPALPLTTKKEEDADMDDDDGAGDMDIADGTSAGGSKAAAPTALPQKPNPVLTTIYGQICVAAKSYQSALFYLQYAYEYCPEDPMLCLSLAIASIGRAMQRQADNRHHLIAQGTAFLTLYRKHRRETSSEEQEIQYNFGRAFHQLGLLSLAVKHYEKALELAEKCTGPGIGLEKETAYNLGMIFVLTGARPLADQLYRRWLSF